MHVTMLLSDAAQVADNKLYILGGGWSVIGPQPAPSAVAIKLSVDVHEAAAEHHWELFLEDADGQPVMVQTDVGLAPIEVQGDFTVMPPADGPAGAPVDVALAINVGPIPLEPGSRFAWRLVIDGETPEGAVASFSTRPLQAEL